MRVDEDESGFPENNRLAKYTGKSLGSALTHFEALTTACANKIVQHISTEIITALNAGYKVYIRGIGSLYLVYYPSRWGRHPKSGETIWIEESIRVKFKASSFITKIVNANIKSIKDQARITIANKQEEYPLLPGATTPSSRLNLIPEDLTKSITVQRQLKDGDSRVFIKTGATDLVVNAPIERNAQNSPHVVRSHFQNYLKTEFMYEKSWVHPVSKVVYSQANIKEVIAAYKYISPANYKALWALWTSSTNREALASLFSYSPSTIKRRWDEGADMILLMLIWPELNIKDLKIYPNA